MYTKEYAKFFSKEAYYLLNLQACKKMQEDAGLSEEQQLDIERIMGE
jgi:hypothetical protein